MTERQQNFKERISSLGKQSVLWGVASVAVAIGGLVLAWHTMPIVAPIGLAAAAFSGFKSIQKLWQRHKLHTEVAEIADEAMSDDIALSRQQSVSVTSDRDPKYAVNSEYWRNTVRANQNAQGRSEGL